MKRISSIVAAATVAAGVFSAPLASADEGQQLSVISDLEITPEISNQNWVIPGKDANRPEVKKLQATSPAMDGREIPLAVIPAKTEGRPTIYLLNGAGSSEQNTDWLSNSNVVDFYKDKNVNVVIPQAGAFSFYTDWEQEPNSQYLKGKQKWETFLTKELPGAIEPYLKANNKRAIAGMSMSATSSLLLAQHNQGMYNAVGSYAGCAATSYPLEYEFLRLTVNRGGAQPEQMWGPQGSPNNVYNDALVNAENLRGSALYISSATGLASATDMPSYYTNQGMPPAVASAQAVILQGEGGVIEAAANHCTHNLKSKLDSKGIEATYNFRNAGTHSWPGWREDLEKSWPVFKDALGVED